jgi:two-component system, NtrC family, phosphoglycerate transport system response regulator PgtA
MMLNVYLIIKYLVLYGGSIDEFLESKYKIVAIVDDEEDIITLFKAVLQENGYHVMGFTNPLFALNYINNHPNEFGLIILDYRMSPMQGCELSKKISAINPKIKMMFITAYNDIVNNGLNLEIVKKPITNTKLLQIIERYLT